MTSKRRWLITLLIGVLGLTATATGTPLFVSESQTETLGTGSDIWAFTVTINGGGNIPHSETFTHSYTGNYSFNLLYALPGGSTINSAVLDLSALTTNLASNASLFSSTGTFNTAYVPTNTPADVVTFLSVTAGGVTHVVSAGSVDLLALFGPAALSTGDIEVAWRQVFTINANNSNWIRNQSAGGSTGTYHLTGSATTTATAALNLDYSGAEDVDVPEPATFGFIGSGMLALAFLGLRLRSRR